MSAERERGVPISRDEMEYVLVPWFGPRYERWLRANTWPDPIDRLVVRIPEKLDEEYRQRSRMTPLSRDQRQRLGIK